MMLPHFVRERSLPQPPGGWFDYDYAALDDGALALIRTDRDFTGGTSQGGVPAWSGVRLRLSIFKDGDEKAVAETDASPWPRVARFNDGRWVVVAARCDAGEKNARVLAADGHDIGCFAVGDHAVHVACVEDEAVWIGYGDESAGIGPLPAGAGLASFSATGEQAWLFDLDQPPIYECCALSVSRSDVWACTYTDFPIIRVRGQAVRVWENQVTGADAIVVDDDHVILAGGYPTFEGLSHPDESDRIVLLRLASDHAVRVAEFRIPTIVERGAVLCGRDGALHIISGCRWLTVTCQDWLASLR